MQEYVESDQTIQTIHSMHYKQGVPFDQGPTAADYLDQLRRGYRISWRGGGRHSQAHTPLDIVRVTSSALRKSENHPHSWTFTSTPPLDIARVTSSTFQGGGGVITPVTPPPWIRHCNLPL